MATVPLWVIVYDALRDRPRVRDWVHVTAGSSDVVHAVGATILSKGALP